MAEESLAKMAGKGATVELRGKTYKLSPLTVNDLAELEAYVRDLKIRDFLAAAKAGGFTNQETVETLKELSGKGMSQEDMSGYMSSMTGIRFLLWRAVVKDQKEVTLEQVGDLIGIDNLDAVSAILEGLGLGEETPANPPEKEPDLDGKSATPSSPTTTT